jgi:hypothetical protein
MEVKGLETFLKICRRHGVQDIVYEGVTVKFGDMPSISKEDNQSSDDIQVEGELTPEELMFMAVRGE